MKEKAIAKAWKNSRGFTCEKLKRGELGCAVGELLSYSGQFTTKELALLSREAPDLEEEFYTSDRTKSLIVRATKILKNRYDLTLRQAQDIMVINDDLMYVPEELVDNGFGQHFTKGRRYRPEERCEIMVSILETGLLPEMVGYD